MLNDPPRRLSYQPESEDRAATLSERELQIATLAGAGRVTKEIAELLDLSPATVSAHRRNICRKLHLHSTAELVAFCARLSSRAAGGVEY